MEYSRSSQEKRQEEETAVTSDKKVLRYITYGNNTLENPISSTNNSRIAKDRRHVRDEHGAHSKTEVEERGT